MYLELCHLTSGISSKSGGDLPSLRSVNLSWVALHAKALGFALRLFYSKLESNLSALNKKSLILRIKLL